MISEDEPIEAVIFLTEEAKKRNWYGSRGLAVELNDLQSKRSISVRTILIARSDNKESIERIISTVMDQLQQGDKVIFDITHAFRYQPLIALWILHLAVVVYQIQICGIYFPDFLIERNTNTEIPIVSVTDLTTFIELSWITNIYSFEEYGKATPLYRWINQKKRELFIRREASQQTLEYIKKLEKFANRLSELSLEMETNRGPTLKKAAERVLDSIRDIQRLSIVQFPIELFIKQVEKQVRPIAEPDLIESGLNAVLWCVEHGLIQQAYTMLDEILITATCLIEDYSVEEAKDSDNVRNWIASGFNGAIKIVAKGEPQFENNRARKLADELLENYPKLIEQYGELKDDRNDLNHAGWRKQPQKAKEFINKFSKMENERNRSRNAERYLELVELIRQYWRENKPDHIREK
jgi:CRISPR-associated DxTHG motif protein